MKMLIGNGIIKASRSSVSSTVSALTNLSIEVINMANASLPFSNSTKQCTRCNEVKPLDAFSLKKLARDGRSPDCKACHNALYTKWKTDPETRERIKQYKQQWKDSNPEYYRNYNATHAEEMRAYKRKWEKANPNAATKWAKANPEKRRAIAQRWLEKNPERRKEQSLRYAHKRRVLLENARCDFTPEQWEQIKAFYNYRCAFCGEKKPLTQDHVIPVTKGGDHTAENIIPLCLSCNSSKGNRDVSVTYQPHLLK